MELKPKIILSCPCMSSKERFFSDFEMNQIIQCFLCKTYQHKYCMNSLTNMKPNYICPKCQIRKSNPFLEFNQVLSNQKIMMVSNPNNHYLFQNNNILFPFSLDIFLPEINYSKNNFIVFTCLLLDETGFKFQWPGDLNLTLNGISKLNLKNINKCFEKKIMLRCNKEKPDNNLYKIRHLFFDNFLVNGNNNLNFTFIWNKKTLNNIYVISIDLVKLLTMDEILKNIHIKENSRIFPINSNIIEKINFIEPLSQMDYIKIPVKGVNCVHLSCFDYETFLIQNTINHLFKCPICKKNTGPVSLDIKMLDLLEKYKGKVLEINDNYEIISIEKDSMNMDNNDDICMINDENENDNNKYNDYVHDNNNEEIIEIESHIDKNNLNNDIDTTDLKDEKKNQTIYSKLKFECVLIKINKEKFPFFKEFDKSINIDYIQKYSNKFFPLNYDSSKIEESLKKDCEINQNQNIINNEDIVLN